MIVLDVWGGPRSTEMFARFILPMDEAMEHAKTELEAGFLVNLRKDVTFGPESSFDRRDPANNILPILTDPVEPGTGVKAVFTT